MEPGSFWTALVFAVIPFVILLGGLWWIDRYEKEPTRLLILALVFGGVIAPVVAYGIENGLDITTSFSSQLIVPKPQLGIGTPLAEELVRGAAVLIVFLLVRFEVDDVLDGIVYGGVVGVGFGAAANFVSIWSTPAIGEASASLYASIVTGLDHVFYGALIGLALALWRRRRTPETIAAAVAGTGLAFGFHLLHDYLPWIGASGSGSLADGFGREVLTQAPNYFGVVVLGVIAVWAGGRERLIIARELHGEVQDGVVTLDEYAAITQPAHRAHTLLLDLLWRGDRVWRLRRRLWATEIELAFRKYHREDREQTQSRAFGDEDDYRAQIADLRGQLAKHLPAAETSRRTELPRRPGNTIVAGVGNLAGYLALVGVFVLIWYLAFAPGSDRNVPTVDPAVAAGVASVRSAPASGGAQNGAAKSGAGLSVSAPGGGAVSTGGGSPLAGGDGDVSLSGPTGASGVAGASEQGRATANVLLCHQIRLTKCVGAVHTGGTLPSATRSFVIAVIWTNLSPGDTVALGFYSLDTRQPVANEHSYDVVRPNDYGLAYFQGPFPRLNLVVTLKYNGAQVDKVWQFEIV